MRHRSPPPVVPTAEAGWRPFGKDSARLVALLREGPWEPLQEGAGRSCYRVGPAGGAVFAKRYLPGGLGGRLRDFLIHRKPWRAYTLGIRLVREGLSTPRPLGLFLRGRGLWREALLVTEWVGPALGWREAVAGGRRGPDGGVSSLGRLLGALHARGYYHGDLAGNLVFAGDGRDRPFLLDLEDLHRPLSWKRRVKNLEELGRALPDLGAVSLRERWSFLLAYVDAAGLDPSRAGVLWRNGREAQRRRLHRAARAGQGAG